MRLLLSKLVVTICLFSGLAWGQSPLINCADPSGAGEVEVCDSHDFLRVLDRMMSLVVQDAANDMPWLNEQDLEEITMQARHSLNFCGDSRSCLEDVYISEIQAMSPNSLIINGSVQYKGQIYVGSASQGSCPDGSVLVDNNGCQQPFGAGPDLLAITHQDTIAVKMTFISAGNAHICSFRGLGAWNGESWVVADSQDEDCELTLQFAGSDIKVEQNSACNAQCGMRATDGLNQVFGPGR